jgi:hypothetical protein
MRFTLTGADGKPYQIECPTKERSGFFAYPSYRT